MATLALWTAVDSCGQNCSVPILLSNLAAANIEGFAVAGQWSLCLPSDP